VAYQLIIFKSGALPWKKRAPFFQKNPRDVAGCSTIFLTASPNAANYMG
jgi:hypothetical protein